MGHYIKKMKFGENIHMAYRDANKDLNSGHPSSKQVVKTLVFKRFIHLPVVLKQCLVDFNQGKLYIENNIFQLICIDI